LLVVDEDVTLPAPGEHAAVSIALQFGDADTWSPAVPALYVLRVELRRTGPPADPREGRVRDELWTTFGIRHLAVDTAGPSIMLNGERMFFRGVGLHGETLAFGADGDLVSGTPAQRPEDVLTDLRDAAAVGADLLRAGHQPADPLVLMLADRLGFGVWEEVPLYHASPLVFAHAMSRGIPQQMLREMALRDMNRPSVLFHGLANESTGDDERTDALSELHEVDRAIDGTRLTGQAAYGWRADDPTHAPLDVAGFTSYHGVFYGDDAALDTRRALMVAHDTHPEKPIMVLEFGRWADEPVDEQRQRAIFEETYRVLESHRGDELGGFVAGATWWSLHDFATPLAGIRVEQFGLYRPDGTLRPAGELAARTFVAPAGRGDALALSPELVRPRVRPARILDDWALPGFVAYGLALSVGALGGLLLVLTRRGGRAIGRAR
jgi:beta-glucuronidase